MTILYTSLAEIKSFNPCASGWKDVLKGQNKLEVDSILFPLIDCVVSNSFADVCWLLGKRKIERKIFIRAARLCADSVAHLNNSSSKRDADDADDAAYAADDADDAAYAADDADDAAYAAAAAQYAAHADDAAAYAVAYAAAYDAQKEKNKQFLRQAILEFQENN